MVKFSDLKRTMTAALILLVMVPASYAGNVAVRAGYTPSGYNTGKFTFDSGSDGTSVLDSAGSPLPVGNAVQCWWVGSNGNINDPGYGDDVLIGTLKMTGDDADTWNLFSGQTGKFYHDYSASGSQFVSGAGIYFRTWDNSSPEAGGSLFGESNIVSAAYDANIVPLPLNCGLTTTRALLTQAVPAAPAAPGATGVQAPAGGSPGITITFNTAQHGRWYNLEVSQPAASSSGPFNYTGYKTTTLANTQHKADTNVVIVRTTSITLGQTDDDKYFKVRLNAGNDYGTTGWVESAVVHVPATADPNIPVAITDLQATIEGRTVTISWTAPYYINKYGTQTKCSSYDIRVSTEAIVNSAVSPFSPGTTNPLGTTTWSQAQSVGSYFASVPPIPSPSAFGVKDSITVPNIAQNGTFFFGIKSQSATGNTSYISNVAGVQVGTAAASTETKTYAFTRSAGGLGINVFSIPYNIPLVQPVISNLKELVENINIQAGSNVVYSFGWYDGANKRTVGYEMKYGSLTLNDFTANPTSGLAPMNAVAIEKDKPYQINVIRDVNFTVKGMR